MGTIHHKYVPGFYRHLQTGMNRVFSSMRAGEPWWRHNYSFESVNSVTNCVGHGQKWAHLVVPAERLKAFPAGAADGLADVHADALWR